MCSFKGEKMVDQVPSWLKRLRAPDVTMSELTGMARTGRAGMKGAALMRLVQLYRDDSETVKFLEELAMGASKDEPLMGNALVGDVCILLLRSIPTEAARDAVSRILDSWDPDDIGRLQEVLARGL